MPGIIKSSNEVRTSTTTLADDSELFFTLDAQKMYEIEFNIISNNSATATIPNQKYAWYFTGTLIVATGFVILGDRPGTGIQDGQVGLRTLNVTVGTCTTPAAVTTVTTNGSNGRNAVRFMATVKVGDSGGTFSLQWAQGTSSGNQTTVFASSNAFYKELADVPS